MKGLIIFLCVCIVLSLSYVFTLYRKHIKVIEILKARWGKRPVESSFDKIESVSAYWINKLSRMESDYFIDKITWNDLNMDEVFKRINTTFSSVGAEYLYARLHKPIFNMDELKDYERIIQSIESNDTLRDKISVYLSRIGKCDYNGVNEFLFSPKGKRLRYGYLYYILALMPLVSLFILFVNYTIGLSILAIVFISNILIYYKSRYSIEPELISLGYIERIVSCSKKLSKLKDEKLKADLLKINVLYMKIKELASFANIVITKPVGDLAFLVEIVKSVFMVDIIAYNRLVNKMCNKSEILHELWQEIGKLDSAIAVASYRDSLEFYTVPTFMDSDEVLSEQLYHPLVDNPVCNNVTLKRNSIITGSNASGKSTYIKALAINIIFAQTIHTCLAKNLYLKPSFVMTSMAVNDSVIDGDSYFIAEIKSLKRILMKINSDIRCICFVDEILRGTNTVERISASSAILKWLAKQNCICVVASHDIELVGILKDLCDNYHFREQVTESKGITFDYKIHDGYSTTTNAIKLLEYMEYPDDIIVESKKYSKDYSISHQWS